jgi:hypothetical protein
MKITARIPKDRMAAGTIEWGAGEHACRGKADNQAAMDHGNPKRDPRRPFGDHPAGRYTATQVDGRPADDPKFGPYRIHVQPADLSSDDECAARENSEKGDDGIMIHGGAPQADGVSLRATHGCLRVSNATIKLLALAVVAAQARGEKVEYICEAV